MDLEDEGGCRTREIRERSDLFKEGCTLYSTSGFRTGGKREEGKRLLFLFIFEYRIRSSLLFRGTEFIQLLAALSIFSTRII